MLGTQPARDAVVDRPVQQRGTGKDWPGADHLRPRAMVAGLHRRDFALRAAPAVGAGLDYRVQAGAAEGLEQLPVLAVRERWHPRRDRRPPETPPPPTQPPSHPPPP